MKIKQLHWQLMKSQIQKELVLKELTLDGERSCKNGKEKRTKTLSRDYHEG
jgi:hypothetical protein